MAKAKPKKSTAKPVRKPAKQSRSKKSAAKPTAKQPAARRSATPLPPPEASALLAAILADPLDDRARLVYGDALQEVGDPRGELIAVQLTAGAEAEARAKELLAKHRKVWQDFGARNARYTWDRGCIDRVTVSAPALIAAGPRMFELHPIRDLRIHGNGASASLQQILKFPLHCVALLQVGAMTPDDLVAFAGATTLRNLEDVDLGRTRLGQHAALLGASTAFPKLHHVHLGGAAIDDKQLAAVVRGPFLANVVSLGLAENRFGAAGLAALAAAPWTTKLETLNLSFNRLTDEGLAALARSPYLTNLKTLYIENYFGAPEGAPPPYGLVAAEALAAAASTTLKRLEKLDMSWSLTPEAEQRLSAAFKSRLVTRTERFA